MTDLRELSPDPEPAVPVKMDSSPESMLSELASDHEAIVKRLRSSPAFAHVVIVRALAEVKTHMDVWGPLGDRAALLAALKQQFDPAAILNAGRGPI